MTKVIMEIEVGTIADLPATLGLAAKDIETALQEFAEQRGHLDLTGGEMRFPVGVVHWYQQSSGARPHWLFSQGNYDRWRCTFRVEVVVQGPKVRDPEQEAWRKFDAHRFDYVEFQQIQNEDPDCPERKATAEVQKNTTPARETKTPGQPTGG